MEINGGYIRAHPGSSIDIGINLYHDGTNWRYVTAGTALKFEQVNYGGSRSFQWTTAPTGAAGAVLTGVTAMSLDGTTGNLGVLGTVNAANASMGAPSFSFTGATNSGLYRDPTTNWPCISATGVMSAMFWTGGVMLPAGSHFSWAATNPIGANGPEVAIMRRNAAGLEVNTGTIGQYRDLVLRGVESYGGMVSVVGSTGTIAGGAATPQLEVRGAGAAGDGAFMTFHRPGAFAAFFGLDTDNTLKIGGYSLGAASYRIHHDGFAWPWVPIAGETYKIHSSGKDVVAHRSNTSGVYWFGTPAASTYLFYDGATYQMPTAPLCVQARLTIGGGAAQSSALHVHAAANMNFVAHSSTLAYIGNLNDANTAWQPLTYVGSMFGPLTDNGGNLGTFANRWSAVYAVSGTINTSDQRGKTNITPCDLGLDFINSLHPVSYVRKVGYATTERVVVGEEEVPEHYDIDNNLIPATTKPKYEDVAVPVPGVRTHYGLIAQDVALAVQAAGVKDFGGYVVGDAMTLPKDNPVDAPQGLNYSEFVAPLIKAVQELSARVKVLEAQLAQPAQRG